MDENKPISRRNFFGVSAAATAALAVGGNIQSVFSKETACPYKAPPINGQFPDDFWWGAATAAYQVEGAANEDGRAPSIWDTFSHTPGKVVNGDTGDISCDQYHRYESDIKLMAELGIKHYRFSISWPRIIPQGRGKVNDKGMDYYKRLVDTLLKHDITPHATLYHWDLPQVLQDKYKGWESREAVKDFGDYATAVVKNLGDKVGHWMTLNEISTFTYNCYGVNQRTAHAPGINLNSKKEFYQVVHNALLAHGTACQAIRAASPRKSFVSVAENYESYVPVFETPETIEAAKKAFMREEKNGGIIIPILTGKYDEGWLQDVGANAPTILSGDMNIIGQPLDELGFNCYMGNYVRAADNAKGYEVLPFFPKYPRGNTNWLSIVPESIYWGVRLVSEAVGATKLPIFISENGCADGSVMNSNGEVLDIDRIMYYRNYLTHLHRSVTEGYPMKGYIPWSLMDNFEWQQGYSQRFGMVHVDYATQKRTPKLSYQWYKEVIKNNRVM
ncbi:MAG: GH1 family beta-glucosidase [Bacteroidales bacterium]|nr:GH1 family beta-glucosidase [Bacteroidales bacterium]